MTAILTAAEMRALEGAAIDGGEVTALDLMERAGRGVVEAIVAEWPELAAGTHRAAVLCGPGNNGGDGFVVARLLSRRGWTVEAFLLGDPARLPPDAKANHDRWLTLGRVRPYVDSGEGAFWLNPDRYGPNDLLVDALFGIGLARPVEGADSFALTTRVAREHRHDAAAEDYPRARVVAIDLPSGLCADSGRHLRPADAPRHRADIRADLTVTFHALKPGHVLQDGPAACGTVRVVDIGLGEGPARPALRTVDAPAPAALAKRGGHKYGHGHAVVLGGGAGRGGAARLAARGALRIGAGLVTVAVPPLALQENAARLDAVMLRPARDPADLAGFLADPRLNAFAAGPGLGTGDKEAAMLVALLESARFGEDDRGVVLDADALTILARDPSIRARLPDRVVVTPHEGEFARLFPEIAEEWAAPATAGPAFSKLDAARAAARALGATVLLKGRDTVIADASGRTAIHAALGGRAAPWLATAGTGDVLTGFVAGLLARGLDPFEAACAAVWLHVECARRFGPGLVAEDLPEELPGVFCSLGV